MIPYRAPKGVFDVLPQDPKEEYQWRVSARWSYLEEVVRSCARVYGYKEIRTPIFEETELFVKGVGEGSDIVTKEMYTFCDKGDRSITLRPEGTASVIRAFVEHHLHHTGGLHKYFYIGPMFRYERPQAGRYRQHHQFGVEAIGSSSPEQDLELIDFLLYLYRKVGLTHLQVMLNTVGDSATKESYQTALRDYFLPHFDALSPESKVRFEKNVLRILDSKDEQDQILVQQAPSIHAFLSQEAKDHFEELRILLQRHNIPFTVNPNLVRGLDYYTKTVFEVVAPSLGAQNALGGGGRYDGLIQKMGGPNLPSCGFATGLERLLQTMEQQHFSFPPDPAPLLFLIPVEKESRALCLTLLSDLRHSGYPVGMDSSSKKVSAALQTALEESARFVVVIGDRERTTGEIEVKELSTHKKIPLSLDTLESFLHAHKETSIHPFPIVSNHHPI